MADLIGADEALRALDWERRLTDLQAENEQLRNLLAGAEQRAQEAHSENQRLTVELTHRVGWEERCLDAEAAAARLERQNAELAREAIGAKAAWMDLQQNARDLKDFIIVANERDALRSQNDQARELYAAMLAELNALRPVVDAAILFRDARIAMQSQGWAAHAQETEALEALFKSLTVFVRHNHQNV